MPVIKRSAFWPLLALVCVGAASATVNADHGPAVGTLAGLALSVSLTILIDCRRQRRWAAGRPRRLLP